MLDQIQSSGFEIKVSELPKEQQEFLEKQNPVLQNPSRPKNGISLMHYIVSLTENVLILTAKVNKLEKQLNEQHKQQNKNQQSPNRQR